MPSSALASTKPMQDTPTALTGKLNKKITVEFKINFDPGIHSQSQLSEFVVGSPGGRGLTPMGGQSRLKSEFEVLEGLGQGGFGDVLKVLSMCSVLFMVCCAGS